MQTSHTRIGIILSLTQLMVEPYKQIIWGLLGVCTCYQFNLSFLSVYFFLFNSFFPFVLMKRKFKKGYGTKIKIVVGWAI